MGNKNILVLANDKRTYFYYEVSKEIIKEGHNFYWGCFSNQTSNWLKGKGVNRSRILDITDYGIEWVDGADSEELESYISWFDDNSSVAARNIVLRDRKLKDKDTILALRYIATIVKYGLKFLKKKNIDIVFGEQSWAFEMVIGQLCDIKNIPVANPRSVRVPPGRFAFFKGEKNKDIFEIDNQSTEDRSESKKFLKRYLDEKPTPEYYSDGISVAFPGWKELPSLLEPLRDKYNETRFHYRDLPSYRPKSVLRYIKGLWDYARWPFRWDNPPSNEQYIFMTLHRSPESSVDVVGDYFSDQVTTIRALSRSIPSDYRILVKEHSSAIGERPAFFYDSLSSIPKLDLVNPSSSSFKFIEKADFVLSIAGTVSYEAALMGVPSSTVVPMFFSPLMTRKKLNPYATTLKEMRYILNNTHKSEPLTEDKIRFIDWIISNSFEGIISNPYIDPRCMSNENIDSVSSAIIKMLSAS